MRLPYLLFLSIQTILNPLLLIHILRPHHLHLTLTVVEEEAPVLHEEVLRLLITTAVVATVDIIITTIAITIHLLQLCHLFAKESHGLQIRKKRFVLSTEIIKYLLT
jgi:hypothetical protein